MPTRAARMSAEDHWLSILESGFDRRCDLEILLREEFRHRVQLRAGQERFGSHDCRDIRFSVLLSRAGIPGSIERAKAEIVLALHLLLDAYGFGTATAIAVVDATELSSLRDAEVRPTVIEHSEIWRTRRGQAVA